MKVVILNESGFEEAALGVSLSYRHLTKEDIEDIKNGDYKVPSRIKEVVMPSLSHKGGGHNKFLESMTVTLLIQANRAFWSQFDTYRVGMTKQSESTMHTLAKRKPTPEDFEPDTDPMIVSRFIDNWSELKGDIDALRRSLPQGWLETRVITTNYKTLQNICNQRKDHRSKDWREFYLQLIPQLRHPWFVTLEFGS